MAAVESVDITSSAFALRLANLLVATRATTGLGVGAMSKASDGRFSRHDLKEFERGTHLLDEATLDELAQLYRCDLGLILPLRLPVAVSSNAVSAGGVEQPYDGTEPEVVLAAYLTLVRTLRRQKKAPVVDLRRDDLEVLAGFLHEPPETVVHRLATLMLATQTKRTAMVAVLATGAVVIGLVGSAVAVGGSETSPPTSPVSDPTVVVDTTGPADTTPSETVVDTTIVPLATTVLPTTVVPATVPPTVVPPTVVPPTVAPSAPPPATTTRPPVIVPPPVTATTVPLVDTDLTTTTTIVATDAPPIPGG